MDPIFAVMNLTGLGVSLGVGMVALAAGLGIGRIGGSAMDAMGRQPEAAGSIQVAMIIAAALIEGVALAAIFAGFPAV